MLEDIKSAVLESKDGLDADQWSKMLETSKRTLLFLLISWLAVLFLVLSGSTEDSRRSYLSMPILFIIIPVLIVVFVTMYRVSSREVARRFSENIERSKKTRGR